MNISSLDPYDGFLAVEGTSLPRVVPSKTVQLLAGMASFDDYPDVLSKK
jgi:hypothetical protein